MGTRRSAFARSGLLVVATGGLVVAGMHPGCANTLHDDWIAATSDASAEAAATGESGTTGADTGESSGAPTYACDEGEGGALFQQRIAPLLATDRPKTCNQCHLSGVDLALFVRATPCQTMACLETRGLVDLAAPSESVILQWISRAAPDSELITDVVIDEEYQGFLAWIEQEAACQGCGALDGYDDPCGDEGDKPTCAFDTHLDPEDTVAGPGGGVDIEFEDPGDCSEATLEALFRHRVYAWRDRCYPCHFDSSKVEAPKWITTGSCALASLSTLRTVLERGYIDVTAPTSSRLLLKPLSEELGGVEHGGHAKFGSLNDPAYLDFLDWIVREAECVDH